MAAATRTNVWLDCDPGHDDALAIVLMGHSPDHVSLLGISTSAGNQTIGRTTKNAIRMTHVAGMTHVPVFKGAHKPLLREIDACPEIHGESGLEGTHVWERIEHDLRQPNDGAAISAIYGAFVRAAREQPDVPRVLLATGPLTNVALLLAVYPEVLGLISRIVIMGGASRGGNTHPVAEFNIQQDPHAARMVLEAGTSVEIVLVPLEVTHTVLFERPARERFSSLGTVFGQMMIDLMDFFSASYRDVFGFAHGPPVHDPVAAFFILSPDAFKLRRLRVDVVTDSALTSGQTVCDIWNQSRLPANVSLAESVDVPRFWDAMFEAVARADRVSCLNASSS